MEAPRPHKCRAEAGDEDGGEELVVQFRLEEVVTADAGLGAGGHGPGHQGDAEAVEEVNVVAPEEADDVGGGVDEVEGRALVGFGVVVAGLVVVLGRV
jgi:hypothetical protein